MEKSQLCGFTVMLTQTLIKELAQVQSILAVSAISYSEHRLLIPSQWEAEQFIKLMSCLGHAFS